MVGIYNGVTKDSSQFYIEKTIRTNNIQVLLADLRECSRTRNLGRGRQVHAEAAECGHDSNIHAANSLISMYARCGCMLDARQVFDSVNIPNVVSWNALILGYAKNGQGRTALDLFGRMKNGIPSPNSVTLVAAIKACTSLAVKGGASSWAECRQLGKEIHKLTVDKGSSDIYVQSTLIDMYAKCGSMMDARLVFDSMKHPNVVSWTALILGYAENGQGLTALEMFIKMKIEGPPPNSVTFVAALKACSSLAVKSGSGTWRECRQRGKEIHDLAMENGCDSDVYVQSTLIDMYAKCGSILEARQVFESMKHPNVVSWSVLILGYAENGQGLTALDLFTKMRKEGPAPDSVTFVAALRACVSLAVEAGAGGWEECRERGKKIHELAVENGCDSDVYVQCTLIDVYAKCGSMVEAHQVFDNIRHPNVVPWTALILGYADNEQGLTALSLFTRMRREGPAPDAVTFSAVLKACGLVGGLEFGRKIHLDINCELDVVLVTCLVDFYAKCGSLVEAESIFDLNTRTRNITTWNALLAGFSSRGDHQSVFRLLEGMPNTGLLPDSITFLCILTCCSHAGLVEKGKEYFDLMSTKYGIFPSVEHYTCMLDMLGRANKLDDAMALLERMPCSPNDVTWKTILGGCRKWKNVYLGRMAFQSLIDFSDRDSAPYVLLGQIYGSRGMLQEQEMVMRMRDKSL